VSKKAWPPINLVYAFLAFEAFFVLPFRCAVKLLRYADKFNSFYLPELLYNIE
jgi:hypothetical protein